MKKRILSILLAALMLLSALPLGMVDTAYAAETSGVAAQSYYVAGGQCGDDLTWTLDSSGTLTISGTGPMYGYSLHKNPWCDSALRNSGISTRVKNVEISSGVTTLGAYALSACDSMVSVSLPETLLAVGESCFFSSTALHNISIPNSVRSIGDCAFSGCNGLTRVTLGSSLKGIGGQAFKECSSLSSIVIPEGVTAIEYSTFEDCSNLMEITIPRTVTSIGRWAFDGCYGLSKVTFTGTRAQWNAIDVKEYNDPLLSANITFAGSGPAAPTVTAGTDSQGRPTLKWKAVSGAAKYEVYRSYSENGPYTKYSTVTGTTYTNTAYLENGTTYYYRVRALNSSGVAGAYSSVVYVTYKQTLSAPTVTGGNDSQGRPTLKWNAVSGAAKYEVYRARSMNGDYIKYSTVTGTSYTNTSYIEDGNTYYYKVRALDASGTAGAWSSIVSVTYRAASTGNLSAPAVTGGNDSQGRPTLRWKAVSGAAKYEVYRARSKDGDYIKYSTVTGTSYTNISYIENGNTYYYKVRALDADGTAGAWSSIVSVTYRAASTGTLSAPAVTGGNDAQGRPTLKWNAVTGAAKYEVYRARSKDGDYIKYSTVTGTSYTNTSYIENGNTYYYKVRALDSDGEAGPFSDVVSVTYTARPALVASGKCGDSASWKLDAEGTLTITGAGPMADYGQHASDNCAPWRTYANDIKKVVVQKGVTAIGSYAFASLERVTSVTIPEGVTSIGSSAFENCGLMAYGGLGAVTLPEGLTTIGSSAFSGSYMDSLTLPESLRTIGGAAFEKSPLKTLTIPGGVTSIGNGAFSNSHLTSIQLPDGAQLGAMLFYQCYELTDVTLPADLTVIGPSMFENCTKLTHVTIPSGVTRIEREAFTMCGALEEIRLPEGVETIGVIAFSGCVAMTGAYLPRSLTTIESGAFSACRSLTDVYYGGTAAEWAAISVADRNDPLLNAALHCTGQSASRLDVPAMTLGEDCSDGKPTVWWPAVTGAERYEIWRAQAASDGSAPAASAYTLIVSADVTFHKDTTAEADTWYYYKVRAVSGSTYSDFSQAARRYCEAPPTMDTPEITSLELDDSGKPVLTWRTVEGAARYQVFRSEDNDFSYSPMGTVLPTGSDTITWTDTTAVSGTGYYYGVGCYDDNGHYSSFGGGEWWVTAR